LVVPAFGIISHTISINSGRAIFGCLILSSPIVKFSQILQIATYYMQESQANLYSTNNINPIVLLEYIIYKCYLVLLVILYSVLSNPQVTKTQTFNSNFNSINKELITNMLVGTLETVRMLSIGSIFFNNSILSIKDVKFKDKYGTVDLKFRQ
jgi:hypothetical protein